MEMADRHARLLAELAEIGMAAARELGAAITEAETPERKATLATALHKVSRSVRQSIFLEARLVRDLVRAEREAAVEARGEAKRRTEQRKGQLAALVERRIWDEHEEDEGRGIEILLAEFIEKDASLDDFLTAPLETHIARLCADLGLDPPAQAEGDLEGVDGPARPRGEIEFDAAPDPPP
jgi:hypothetical protein